MKKWINISLTTVLIFLISGCQSSNDASKIYNEAITQMNQDIYYYQGIAKDYNGDNLYSTTEIEQLKDKDNKLYYISNTVLATDENIGELTVMDGNQVHKLAYNKTMKENTYTVDKADTSLMPELQLFINVIETSPMPLKDSSVKNTANGKQLHFIFMENNSSNEKNPKLEYNIKIEKNRIIEVERISYGTGGEMSTMRTVTTYHNFNVHTSMDTKSVIENMQIYK